MRVAWLLVFAAAACNPDVPPDAELPDGGDEDAGLVFVPDGCDGGSWLPSSNVRGCDGGHALCVRPTPDGDCSADTMPCVRDVFICPAPGEFAETDPGCARRGQLVRQRYCIE